MVVATQCSTEARFTEEGGTVSRRTEAVERKREVERGENHRGERQREGTRRNQSGSVARSRGEERGPTCRTATHCPTHLPVVLGRSRFCLSIQETFHDTMKMRCDPTRRLFATLPQEEKETFDGKAPNK